MTILVANDDGFSAPGIRVLVDGLREHGYHTIMVAPSRDRSTVGHSLTLHKPLRIFESAKDEYYVTGSPADCIYMATRYLLKGKPDFIVSGINNGANLGSDIFYSGTVAAAREGILYGVPSMAISLCRGIPHSEDKHHWEAGAHFVKTCIPGFLESGVLTTTHLINVNIPDLPVEKIKGLKISCQGRRKYTDLVQERTDPRNKKYFWVGGAYEGFEDIQNSDCVFVNDGYVAVTPLNLDTTNYQDIPQVTESLNANW